jgi:cytochrome c-type biogenesis protein CcmE
MIKIYLFFILLLSFVFAEEIELGEKLQLDSTTAVSTILENPEDFLGKPVQISGMVVDVCAHRGCWIEVSSDKPYETIKVKVDDGVIVFPITAKGKNVVAEGTLEKLTLSDEEALSFKKHQAEEKGEEFDEAKCQIKDADKTIYRLRGLGAVIK